LTSVTIPNSVTTIGTNAFAGNPMRSVPITAQQRQQQEQERQHQQQEQERQRQQREQGRQRQEQERQRQVAQEQQRLANLYRQAGNSIGNLRNTSWYMSVASARIFLEERYDFGDGTYITQQNVGFRGTVRGTFRVSGNTVIFLSSSGEYSTGTIIGNTLTVGNTVFHRIN